MHILLTTYGLLLIFAIFSFAQWKNAEAFIFTDHLASGRFSKLQNETSSLITKKANYYYASHQMKKTAKTQVIVDEEDKPHVQPDHLDDSEEEKIQNARRSSFLNIRPLLCDESSILEGIAKSCFILFKSLLKITYEEEAFYKMLKQQDPDLEEHFVMACIQASKRRNEEGSPLFTAKQIISLDLESELLESARYGMMRGEKNRQTQRHPEEPIEHYPLQELISINKNPQLMSIWLAPRPLLFAAFGSEEIVESIISTRSKMYKELSDECKSAANGVQKNSLFTLKKKELERLFKDSLLSGIKPEHIDFGVSLTVPQDY